MRVFISLIIAGFMVGLTASGQDKKDIAKDLEGLQGDWSVTELQFNGKNVTEKYKFSLTFKGDTATIDGDGAVKKEYAKLRFKLDPSTMPKCADVTVVGGTQDAATLEGIYELKGDELQLCVKVFGLDRPNEFKSADGSSVALMKLKRQK
jgi:uncharacterized protein (TIGR03067 family)